MKPVEKILSRVREYRPGEDLSMLERAYDFAASCHRGQKRSSGDPFLTHPMAVAMTLAEMKLDPKCVCVGLLHDVVEDTTASLKTIEEEFGPEIAHLVDGVTKMSQIEFSSAEARQAENFRKMMLAMVDDIRVVLVKLADRLHNMRTLQHLPEEKQKRIAQETLEIYGPIAHRLGMGKIRGELEDLAFGFLEPSIYGDLKDQVEKKRKVNEEFLSEVQAQIAQKMSENDIPVTLQGRVKRIYSIYQKMKRQHVTLDQVYDLLAVRILTDTVRNCYGALGIIHNTWRPVPGRIKDYIAMPRPNLYQSLHTSVISTTGQAFEVQIRTHEMHRIAEEGIAAHWKYKEGKPVDETEDSRVNWLRQLVEWQREMRDPGEFLSTLKIDLYPEEVYTFTPKGRVVIMPREATPIDFAYSIHTDVGNQCVQAKVNGRIVPLRYKLRNGDIVEIVTQAGHMPSRDWLSSVKTSKARNKIRHWLNVQQRDRAMDLGKRLLEKEARNFNVNLKKVIDEIDIGPIAAEYGCHSLEDLYAHIGYGKIVTRSLLTKLIPEKTFTELTAQKDSKLTSVVKKVFGIASSDSIEVKGVDGILVYRARCCNPIRGEEIVGYITRGKGIAVHAKNCSNVQNLLYDADRKIEVEWKGTVEEAYTVHLSIHGADRQGLLAEIAAVISDSKSNIRNIEAKTFPDQNATIEVTLDINDKRHLERLMGALKRIDQVFEVERITKTAASVPSAAH
ncbi:MAG: bifunctional (p)ppGpp synthetase/guanosine-3',5'-bis(diphosphate) 3'-pyrophosphohydrolase [Acidobacteriia bacterium]|nr:bifunctional (p)ppGpp synthetase/guanosine-3',5'-bis(diphosphate) 3'-pyrophosphohydrolase [Terriglobia bacterium]